MEKITKQDAFFLIALNASEESSIVELKRDFLKWEHDSIDVAEAISVLIEDGTILFAEREGDLYKDYSIPESIEIAESWESNESWNTVLFLTESGESRWKTDDWGISTDRARHLMFSKQPA